MKRVSLSTMYGVGLIGIAPGTFGSAVAAVMAYGVLTFAPQGYFWVLFGALMIAVVGTAHASRFMRERNTAHDPKEIVIDELVGQWLTYSIWHAILFFAAGSAVAGLRLLDNIAASPLYLTVGFFVFRFFDIVKPWPIGWVDRRVKGGLGVMMDDVIAAIPSGVVLTAIHIYAPLLMGPLEVNP